MLESSAIQLRAYVEDARGKRRWSKVSTNSIGPSEYCLVFDTETRTDAGQALTVGFCRVYHSGRLIRHVLFYAPETITIAEKAVAERYAERIGCIAMTREQFIDDVFYHYGYFRRALVIGLNLPFDLSRLAIGHASARGAMRGGFSLKLSAASWQPPIQVKHLSKYVSMIRYAGAFTSRSNRSQIRHGKRVPPKRGYFLEVRALAAALFSRSFSLKSLGEFLGVSDLKLDLSSHDGLVTEQLLEYADRDVLTTWQCHRELIRRYDALGLRGTEPHLIFSEASIGKASFAEMGIKSWRSVQRDIPSRLLSRIMCTYFGGRSEVRIRRELREVVLCDFLSMYPTVCTLTNLWCYVIAQGVLSRDGTTEVKRILQCGVRELLQRDTWRSLVALVQVKPEADIFPVRAQYSDGADGTIGANYLTSEQPLWFTLADCLASQLLTGKKVRVVKALIFEPLPVQKDLKPILVAGNAEHRFDPQKDDFYRRLIETRQNIKRQRDIAGAAERQRLDVQQNALKIVANATSYGIFAEINVNDHPKKQPTRINAATVPSWIIEHLKDERPGQYFHPLLASTITGGARLMLALAERLASDQKLEWAFCDTDSLAIAKPMEMARDEFYRRVEHVVSQFELLNPYNFGGSILKIEEVNRAVDDPASWKTLFVWAISAKRYVLFNVENGLPTIRKASAHGLGHLVAPYDGADPAKGIPPPKCSLEKIGVQLWQHDVWWSIAKNAIEGNPDKIQFDYHPALKQAAAGQYSATTPRYLRWFDEYNEGRPYPKKLKPFGFVSLFFAKVIAEKSGKSKLRPVAPYDRKPASAARHAFDRDSGKRVPSRLLKSYSEALGQYHLHPEDKFLNGNFLDRGTTVRRHIHVVDIEYIGKESNKWEDQYYLGFNPDEEIRYGAKPVSPDEVFELVAEVVDILGHRTAARELGISRETLAKLLRTKFCECPQAKASRYYGVARDILADERTRLEQYSYLLDMAANEAKAIGVSALARKLNVDPSNLKKILVRDRGPTKRLIDALKAYFDQLFAEAKRKASFLPTGNVRRSNN